MLRDTFYYHSSTLLSAFMRCGVRCLDEFFGDLSRQLLKGGYIVVLHTHVVNANFFTRLDNSRTNDYSTLMLT